MKRKVWMMIEKEMDETDVENQKKKFEKIGYKVAIGDVEIKEQYSNFQKEEMNQYNQWALEETVRKWLIVADVEVGGDLKIKVEVQEGELPDEFYLDGVHLEDEEIEKRILKCFDETELMYLRRRNLDTWEEKGFLSKQEFLLKEKNLRGEKMEIQTNESFTTNFGSIKHFEKTLSNWCGGKYTAYLVNKSGARLVFQLNPNNLIAEEKQTILVVLEGEAGSVEIISRTGIKKESFRELVTKILNMEAELKIKNLF